MEYDYAFFADHANKHRKMFGSVVKVEYLITIFHKSAAEAASIVAVESRDDGDLFSANGAYCKGLTETMELDSSLQTEMPEDFERFYQQFGESVIVTRSEPIWILPIERIIEEFEGDVDTESNECRFFRFASYEDDLFLGLRRSDLTNRWEVVRCSYGLLYSEMIGPQGRNCVVSPSFYEWLKHLIDTDSYPDEIYLRDEYAEYLSVVDG